MLAAGLVCRAFKVIVLLLSIHSFTILVAASPAITREWVKARQSVMDDSPSDIAIGPDGEVYVAGKIGAADLLFVVKYSPWGREAWFRTVEAGSVSIESERPARLAIDLAGNVILGGTVNNGPGKNQDFLVAKFDPDGALLWSQAYDDRGDNDGADSIAVDIAGNVYVSGNVNNSGPRDIVTVKYSSDGALLWSTRFTSADDLACQVLAVPDGTVNVLGSSTGFSADDDILLVRYDSNGTQIWAVHYNGGGEQTWPPTPSIGTDDWPSRMIVDESGNTYVAGYSQRVMRGSYGIVLLKVSPTGQPVWTRRHESAVERPQDLGWNPTGLAFDPHGNVLVAGRHFDGAGGYGWVTTKYDPDGNLLWESPYIVAGIGQDDRPFADMAVDGLGNTYVFGTVPGLQDYRTDSLILQYSSDGKLIRSDRFDGGFNDQAAALGVSAQGDLYSIGKSQDYHLWDDNALTIKYALRDGLLFPVFLNGELNGVHNRTRIVLMNAGNSPAGGVIRFKGADGSARPVPFGGVATEAYPYTIPGNGTLNIESDGTGDEVSGYIEVSPGEEENPLLYGTAFFSVLGNHVSVTDSPPRSTHQIYVSFSGEENTGVAIYNPSDAPTTVWASLLDDTGLPRATTRLIIEGHHQISRFVNESTFFQDYFNQNPDSFVGTLHLRVEQGRRVAALGLIQKKKDGALISMMTSPHIRNGSGSTASIRQHDLARVLTFPQYANGVSGTVLNRTRVVLRNSADLPDSGMILFRQGTGASPTPIDGLMLEEVPFSLPAWGTIELQTDGTGPVVGGYIEVNSERGALSGVEGTEVFDLLGHFTSVDSAAERNIQQVYVSRNSAENTGIAVVCDGQNDPWTGFRATLFNDKGTALAVADVQMGFLRHKSLFVNEIFQDYFASHVEDFQGSMMVEGRLVLLGLIQKVSDGALIAIPTYGRE